MVTLSASATETAEPLSSVPSCFLEDWVIACTIQENSHMFKIIMPVSVDHFAFLLWSHPNHPFVDSVLYSLCFGFWPCAKEMDEHYPESWDESCNHFSQDRLQFLRDQIQEEESLGWLSPLFMKLLPGMYSMPIHAILKPHSDKFTWLSTILQVTSPLIP